MTRIVAYRRIGGFGLQEILIVLVVFTVGILTALEVFPRGLQALRTSRENSIASSLAQVEVKRMQENPDEVPSYIVYGLNAVPVGSDTVLFYRRQNPFTGMDNFFPNSMRLSRIKLDRQGRLLPSNQSWQQVCGVNFPVWMIGEQKRLSGPKQITPRLEGCIVNLNYAPFRCNVPGAGPRTDALFVYGSAFKELTEHPNPLAPVVSNAFYLGHVQEGDLFDSRIWLPADGPIEYRITCQLNYGQLNTPRVYDLVARINVGDISSLEGSYRVVSAQRLMQHLGRAQRKILREGFNPTLFRGIQSGTLRMYPALKQIAPEVSFARPSPEEPFQAYQYKIINDGFGSLLIHPELAYQTIDTPEGLEPFKVFVDYQVYDTRILRDHFTIPKRNLAEFKLMVDSIKRFRSSGPDGIYYQGLGVPVRGLPTSQSDFVLVDLETGGIYQRTVSGRGAVYSVDFRQGTISFHPDKEGHYGARLLFGSPMKPLDIPDIRGRSVRAFYQRRGEWALQFSRAARVYQVLYTYPESGLRPGQCYVGGRGRGSAQQIYFPNQDAGKQVTIGRVSFWDGGTPRQVQDQCFTIQSPKGGSGRDTAYVDVAEALPLLGRSRLRFAFERGDPVKNVSGVSAMVKVFWNPATFNLTNNSTTNANRLVSWAEQYRHVELKTVLSSAIE